MTDTDYRYDIEYTMKSPAMDIGLPRQPAACSPVTGRLFRVSKGDTSAREQLGEIRLVVINVSRWREVDRQHASADLEYTGVNPLAELVMPLDSDFDMNLFDFAECFYDDQHFHVSRHAIRNFGEIPDRFLHQRSASGDVIFVHQIRVSDKGQGFGLMLMRDVMEHFRAPGRLMAVFNGMPYNINGHDSTDRTSVFYDEGIDELDEDIMEKWTKLEGLNPERIPVSDYFVYRGSINSRYKTYFDWADNAAKHIKWSQVRLATSFTRFQYGKYLVLDLGNPFNFLRDTDEDEAIGVGTS